MTKKRTRTAARKLTADPAALEIRRLWGGLPVVDATKALRLFVRPEDVEKATPKDPGCCVFAQACKRVFNVDKILFFRSVAYVELPDREGKHRVERFFLPLTTRRYIAAFDRGEGIIPEAGFELVPPPPSERFANKRAENRARRAARKELSGTRESGSPRVNLYNAIPRVLDLTVRSGTGAVHFTQNSEPSSEK